MVDETEFDIMDCEELYVDTDVWFEDEEYMPAEEELLWMLGYEYEDED